MRLATVPIGKLSLDGFDGVLAPGAADVLHRAEWFALRELAGRRIWNVNSTARGGGVAEMLVTLLAYARGAGVDARWLVVTGDAPFFAITKRLHNRLHGIRATEGRWARSSARHTRRRWAQRQRPVRPAGAG